MPRKPNYKFERLERERAKAAKKAARAQARADKKVTQPEDGLEGGLESASDATVENARNVETSDAAVDATDEETTET